MSDSFFSDFAKYLSDPSSKLAHQALEQMEQSKDPYHDVDHVKRMLADFKRFLQENPKSEHNVHPERVILSICWHDVWKSKRVATNAFQLLHHQIIDGLGSAELFQRAAKESRLDNDHLKQIVYSIRKHAHFQFRPVETTEAKLLRDLDDLDLLNIDRLEKGKRTYAFAAPWRIKVFQDTLKRQEFNLPWSAKQREDRKPQFLVALQKFLEELS